MRIGTKIIGMTLVSSVGVVLLTSVSLVTLQRHSLRETFKMNAEGTTKILAEAVSGSVLFLDQDGALTLLNAAANDPAFLEAAVFDAAGDEFARFAAATEPAPDVGTAHTPEHAGIDERAVEETGLVPEECPEPCSVFRPGFLLVASPILSDGDTIGTLVLARRTDELDAAIGSAAKLAGLVMVAGLGVAAIGSWLTQRTITRPVAALTRAVNRVAEGDADLTKRIDIAGRNELAALATAFNAFLEQVHDIVHEVKGTTNTVADAATQIAGNGREISRTMEEQRRETGNASAATEEMSSSVATVAQLAASVSGSAGNATDQAETGRRVMLDTIERIKIIDEQVNHGAQVVQRLGDRGEQIKEVISVINEIAEQTNLLALNAAIEAARAGEHGRGFAVVADEVRKLAERTTQATQEVADSIVAIRTDTQEVVERMGASREAVGAGVEMASTAGQTIGEITDAIRALAEEVAAIAASTSQQSAAGAEIAGSVERVDTLHRQNAERLGESAAAAEQLSGDADLLRQLVNRFQTA